MSAIIALMNTLKELQNGQLHGTLRLKLSCGLENFPGEILDLSDTLEILDLTGNRLSSLPNDFGKLKKLRILFLSQNLFTEVPAVLSKCPELGMVGFKANQISHLPENVFPPKVHWLILTDNCIQELPESIGDLHLLQKCALAGNRLTHLPATMRHCKNLELLRISANHFETIPQWLFSLPKLSWLAVAGNPCNTNNYENESLQEVKFQDITFKEKLGEGASGIISKAITSDGEEVAIKRFKGAVTSDGFPEDEMKAAIAAGQHPHLNTPFARVIENPDHADALLFELIPPHFKNLGNPPSFESCSRDTYPEETKFTVRQILNTLFSVASAAEHLHQRGINHGDLYAHNTLVDVEGNAILGDFGGAVCYDREKDTTLYERLEVRAFGCMMEEMLERCSDSESYPNTIEQLQTLCNATMQPSVEKRPLFNEISSQLNYLIIK